MTVLISKPSINLREALKKSPSGIAGEAVLRSDTEAEAREALSLDNHETLTVSTDGVIADFESTGIDDNATSTKLTVSNTGIDVTGTVTADGLTVDGDATIQGNKNETLQLKSTNASVTGWSGSSSDLSIGRIEWYGSSAAGNGAGIKAVIDTEATSATGRDFDLLIKNSSNVGSGEPTLSLRIDASKDISFYEDTGTTPKFFWDASAERLAIGVGTSPDAVMHVGEASYPQIRTVYTGVDSWDMGVTSGSIFRLGKANAADSASLFQTDSGNVGIGTTSPGAKLDVSGAINGTGTSTFGTGLANGVSLGGSSVGNAALFGTSANQDVNVAANGTGNVKFLTGASGSGVGSAAERMRITSAGNVGIGTSSPVNELEVYGVGSPRLAIRAPESIGESIELGFQFGTAANASANTLALIRAIPTQVDPSPLKADLAFFTNVGDVAAEALRIDSSGKFLVATTSATSVSAPSGGYLLEVAKQQNAFTEVLVKNTDTGTAGQADYVAISDTVTVRFGAAGTNDVYQAASSGFLSVDSNHPLTFRTNNTERMRIDSNGDARLGSATTDNTTRTLTVGNILSYGQSVAQGIVVGAANATNVNTGKPYAYAITAEGDQNNKALIFSADIRDGSRTERARLDASGNLLVGTTANADNHRLNVDSGIKGVKLGGTQIFSFNPDDLASGETFTVTFEASSSYNTYIIEYRYIGFAGANFNQAAIAHKTFYGALAVDTIYGSVTEDNKFARFVTGELTLSAVGSSNRLTIDLDFPAAGMAGTIGYHSLEIKIVSSSSFELISQVSA